MDNIQKVLIKAGRKDLAQEYYEKTSAYVGDKERYYTAELKKIESFIKQLKGITKFLEKEYKNKEDYLYRDASVDSALKHLKKLDDDFSDIAATLEIARDEAKEGKQ